jgi:hypothetical protein
MESRVTPGKIVPSVNGGETNSFSIPHARQAMQMILEGDCTPLVTMHTSILI